MEVHEIQRYRFVPGEGVAEGEGDLRRGDDSLVMFKPSIRIVLVLCCCGMGGGVSIAGDETVGGGTGSVVPGVAIASFSTSSTIMDIVFQETLVAAGCP